MDDKCGRIKFNQFLLNKYKPKEVDASTINRLRIQYEIDRSIEIRQLVKEGKMSIKLAEHILKEGL